MKKETKEEALEEILEELEAGDKGKSGHRDRKHERADDIKHKDNSSKKSDDKKAGDETKPDTDETESVNENGAESGNTAGQEGQVQEGDSGEAEEKESEDAIQPAYKKKIDELTDKFMRQVAEFDNFRKRSEKEKSQMFEQGQSNVLEKLLPVVDNFERGLAAAPDDESSKAFVEGTQMIYKQMSKMMEDLGVKPIEALGKEFDPAFHNAVMQVDSEEYGSGVVAQELQKGYMFRETVLRHSMVAVVK